VFARVCVACHRVAGQGIEVGPDLDGIGARLGPADLVESILEPNAKIEPRYALVSLALADGEALAGFVEADDSTKLTLRLPDGTTRTVAKAQVAMRQDLATSNMPEGLGQTLSAREIVDLIEYLQSLRAN
jgi:putative heme-binding domain-containing protein